MSLLKENCPRCNTLSCTFDVVGATPVGIGNHDWQRKFEVFSVCRHCRKSTVFVATNRDYDMKDVIAKDGALVAIKDYINPFMNVDGFISMKDRDSEVAPDHTPDQIANVYLEASTCLGVRCWNAAGAMFRSVIDLTTKSLLPSDEAPGLNSRTRNSLGHRLAWLFETGRLPSELKELADAVQHDGNDGVHDGTLSEVDALDLQDFTKQLLLRIYTEPGRLVAAKERRQARREGRA